ncbi:hypothetical protein ZWY2020_057555 [Hordeum vulgare]|nr:hypothetical protein ZWY2020_057555 [Hordeum vulgare]
MMEQLLKFKNMDGRPQCDRVTYHRQGECESGFVCSPFSLVPHPRAGCAVLPAERRRVDLSVEGRQLVQSRGLLPNIVVSASHLPPSAPPSPPSSVAALETRSQKHACDAFFATIDPVLKAYLDKMNDDAAARAAKQDVDNKAILKAVATQSAWIDALISWKPELKAESASLATSPLVACEIQGQPSHDVLHHIRGPPTVTVESPAVSPVTATSLRSNTMVRSRFYARSIMWPMSSCYHMSRAFTMSSMFLNYAKDSHQVRLHPLHYQFLIRLNYLLWSSWTNAGGKLLPVSASNTWCAGLIPNCSTPYGKMLLLLRAGMLGSTSAAHATQQGRRAPPHADGQRPTDEQNQHQNHNRTSPLPSISIQPRISFFQEAPP